MSTLFSNQLLQNPKDILVLIKAILEFSGFYLFERNLIQFKLFIDGYIRCAKLNGIDLYNSDILDKFNFYLVENYGKTENTSFGWFDYFNEIKSTESEKFELFEKYFYEFLNSDISVVK